MTPSQLAVILDGLGHGITVQGPEGELVYANDAAARLCGLESSEELLSLTALEVIDRFEIVGEDGASLPFEQLPNRLAFVTREPQEGVVGYRLKPSGEDRWSVLRSTPMLSPDGEVQLVINVFQDVTEERSAEERIRFLGEVSTILAASLDVDATLAELARLLVPRVADYCIVDVLGEDEATLRQVVISHRDPERERLLRELRHRYPPEANASHPVTRVLTSGEPVLIPDARHGALADAATDDEHLRLYEALDALSYIVVPLATRGKLLGTISLGTGESGRRFGTSELALAYEIARRAALAIDNARLFRAAQESYAQLNTLLVSAPVGIGFWDRDLRFVRVNDALAAINRATPEEHVGRTLADVLPGLGERLEPLYRSVLETGEPIVHTESTDDAGRAIGDRRHWLSSYYPIRTESDEVIGVGAVIMEITDRKRADDRIRLLAEAGELFSSSLDREEIFRRIAHVVVPRIADACNIFLADGTHLLRVAHAHDDPELERLMDAMPDSYPMPEKPPKLMRRVVGAGEPLLVPTVTRELVDELEQIGLDRQAFVRVGSRSMMFVPFVSRGETLGVLTLGSREPGRYDETDLELALELARRASAAIDNARLVGELQRRAVAGQALEFVGEGVFLVDRDGIVRLWNPAAARITGLAERDVDGAQGGRRPGRLAARAGRRAAADVSGRRLRRRALALAHCRRVPAGPGLRVPRPHRRAGGRAAQERFRLDHLARAPHAARRDLRRRDDSPPRRRHPRRRSAGGDARRDRRRVGATRPDRQRHPAREPARLWGRSGFDRQSRCHRAGAHCARSSRDPSAAGYRARPVRAGAGPGGRGRSRRPSPGAREPRRERGQVLARRRSRGAGDRPGRRAGPVRGARSRARDPGRRARAHLREVLPARPEPLARCRRDGARPLHQPRDRPPHGRAGSASSRSPAAAPRSRSTCRRSERREAASRPPLSDSPCVEVG